MSDTSKTIADSFLFFLAYNFLRQTRIQSSKSPSKYLPVMDELSVGFLAGAFSKFLTTPIANIVTRKQTFSMLSGREAGNETDEGSLRSIALKIRAEKGVRGFWSGYSASLILTLNPSLTFFFFEALKRSLPRSKRQNPSPQLTFLLAAISKALASTITYPFSLAKSRLQSSSGLKMREGSSRVKLEGNNKSKNAPGNVFSAILKIARTDGLGALYEGLGGEVMKGFFSHGITMIVKEAVHKLVVQIYYYILKMLKKYPAPQVLAESVKIQAGRTADNAGDLVKIAKEQSGRMADNIGDSAESGKEQAGRMAKQAAVRAKTQASNMAHNFENWTQETAASAKSQAGQMTDDLGDWTQEVAGSVAENLGDRTQQVANMAKEGTQDFMKKTQEVARKANDRLTTDDT